MTTGNQTFTTMIWLPSQIKNPNCFVEGMPLIVLSPYPNMQAKRKSVQKELDLENGYNILETKKPKLKGAKYVDRKSTRLNSSHPSISRMPSSA